MIDIVEDYKTGNQGLVFICDDGEKAFFVKDLTSVDDGDKITGVEFNMDDYETVDNGETCIARVSLIVNKL